MSGSHGWPRGRGDLPHSTGLRRQPSFSNGDEFDASVESALSPSTQRGGWMTSIDDVRDREPRARARRGGSPAAARGAVEPRAPRRTEVPLLPPTAARGRASTEAASRRGSRATQRDRATPCTTSKRTWSATWPGAPSSTTSPESRLRRRGRHVGPVIAGVPPHRRGVADRSFPRVRAVRRGYRAGPHQRASTTQSLTPC